MSIVSYHYGENGSHPMTLNELDSHALHVFKMERVIDALVTSIGTSMTCYMALRALKAKDRKAQFYDPLFYVLCAIVGGLVVFALKDALYYILLRT